MAFFPRYWRIFVYCRGRFLYYKAVSELSIIPAIVLSFFYEGSIRRVMKVVKEGNPSFRDHFLGKELER